jgi:hypothetical protein
MADVVKRQPYPGWGSAEYAPAMALFQLLRIEELV